MANIRAYYSLAKPGVLYGNVLTTLAGFLFAAGYAKQFNVVTFMATIFGTTLVIAGACVLNNILDQDIDRMMERTRNRAVATGVIKSQNAAIFSAVLTVVGLIILIAWVNLLVVTIGVIGFVVYVWLYGALSKRRSIHGTLVGSISGAMPILAGYCAVTNRIDMAAVLLFLALFFWQFPEFYSIAIYRRAEYRAANIPVMSVIKGNRITIAQIYIYTILFVLSTLLLTPLGYAGWTYFVVMSALGIYWVWLSAQGLHMDAAKVDSWARKNFRYSLLVLLAFSAILSIGSLLP